MVEMLTVVRWHTRSTGHGSTCAFASNATRKTLPQCKQPSSLLDVRAASACDGLLRVVAAVGR